MSAQAGVWNFDEAPASREILANISQTISQYGPDGERTYFSGSMGMLYRPFHTTKESRLEHQPHVSSRGNMIMWDGRLDDREELVQQLSGDLGPEQTDVAIVLAAFERWGTDCFRKLVGDWATSVWDPAQRVLILARDYIGVRQLYYYPTHRRVIWCSYLAPLVLSADHFSLNHEYVAGYLTLYPEAHLTPYREIHAVPPGKFVSIREGNATVQRYWAFDPKLKTRYKTDREYEEHFRHVFRQGVRRRLRSDSPILAELSGGLDSSSIVCVADDIIGNGEAETPRLDTISYYYSDEPKLSGDDFLYFTRVEEKRGRAGHRIDPSKYGSHFVIGDSTFAALPGTIGGRDELQTHLRALMQEHGYRVMLSGIGGDELLGGVPRPESQLADLIVQFRLLELARELEAWSLIKKTPIIQLLLQAFGVLLPSFLGVRLLKEAKVEPWIDEKFARRYQLAKRQLGPTESFGFWLPSRQTYARTWIVVCWQMANRLPPLLGGRETSYPYLDQSLIEFLISVPAGQLLRPGARRSLMRRSLANLLPAEVLSRRTKGVVSRGPMIALQESWAGVEKLLENSLGSRMGYFNGARFQESLISMKHGKPSNLVRLARGLSFELWMQSTAARGLIRSLDGPAIPLTQAAVHARA
ncbi:MAG: asparagine synthase-related protein [Acidobacteria bacterium]|nr:asparagine synthase-related protein [Acidobacteriota bacterium]